VVEGGRSEPYDDGLSCGPGDGAIATAVLMSSVCSRDRAIALGRIRMKSPVGKAGGFPEHSRNLDEAEAPQDKDWTEEATLRRKGAGCWAEKSRSSVLFFLSSNARLLRDR
jgi:hypothetical protein